MNMPPEPEAIADIRSRWSSGPLDGATDQALTAIEDGMPVALIASFPLITCGTDDTLEEVLRRPDLAPFDHIPVKEDGSIVGLLDRIGAGDRGKLVRDSMRSLHERMLISSTASLLTFIEDADRVPCRLVLRGRRIEGVVTLSDFQKLAVRPVLFSLITHLELLMAEWIRRSASEEDWLASLKEDRRAKVLEKWAILGENDLAIDRLSCTEFCDKKALAVKLGAFASKGAAKANLGRIERLRDSVAHAGDYAITAEAAKKVSVLVKAIRGLITELRLSLETSPTSL